MRVSDLQQRISVRIFATALQQVADYVIGFDRRVAFDVA